MTEPDLPLVRVVTINFDGGQMTMDCLASVLASDWPADRLDVVLVDNGSLDDVVERVRRELPRVRIIEPLANTGFAGGCNLGIRAEGPYDLLALVNNDAVVTPGWLRPLVAELRQDDRVGAASPKMVFFDRYVGVDVEIPGAAPAGDDGRTLGICVTAARRAGHDVSDRLVFDEGFFPAETPTTERGERIRRWSWRRGTIRLPIDDRDGGLGTLSLRCHSASPQRVVATTDRGASTLDVDRVPRWFDVSLDVMPHDVVNNAGSALYPGGFGGDRGFLQRDDGRFDDPQDVFAWCGGAVLMRREYLEDIGLFDTSLFLYYEDTDLAWRGQLHGWRYRYVPASVVRHRHAASSGVGSDTFRYYTERNRPIVLVKNAPAAVAIRAAAGLVRRLPRQVVIDIVRPVLRLSIPRPTETRRRVALIAGYLRLLPDALRHRWGSGVSRAQRQQVMRWVETKEVAR